MFVRLYKFCYTAAFSGDYEVLYTIVVHHFIPASSLVLKAQPHTQAINLVQLALLVIMLISGSCYVTSSLSIAFILLNVLEMGQLSTHQYSLLTRHCLTSYFWLDIKIVRTVNIL